MSSPLPPSSAVRCCVRMPGLEASRSTSTVSRFQIASGGYQEHPWKASNWPCTHPDKLLKLLWMPHPSWHTVRLCSSVCLSLSQPCPLCWVWKPGLVLLIQIKAVSWAVRAAVKKYHPLGAFQTTDMGSSQFGRLEVQDQADSMASESCVLAVSPRTGKLLTTGRSSLSVYVSEHTQM